MLSFLVSNAQKDAKDVCVAIKSEVKKPDGSLFVKLDTFFVRNDFVLEPIKINYYHDEINLATKEVKNATSSQILKRYNVTNIREMIGMSFDIEKPVSAKTIEVYRAFGEGKSGVGIINEPYLANGFTVADYSKEKDTLINGAKCFLLKNNKVVSSTGNGTGAEKILQFQLAIDPALKSCAFNFISEKIVQQFGGGAIVYADFTAQDGSGLTIRYSYGELTPSQQGLLDHYRALYNANITLLDKFKNKQ